MHSNNAGIDIDHFLATLMFDNHRCSIGFHPLHSYFAIAVYALEALFKGNYELFLSGLLFHMFTDFQDFYWWK